MNKDRKEFYTGSAFVGFKGKSYIKYWLEVKDEYAYRSVITKPKRRHRRSITPRTLKRLCGYTCFREEAHKHRLFVY